jgi:hypothetical protein
MQEGILQKLNPHAHAPAKPYVHQDYPSVRYHRSGKTQVVNNADEHAALVDHPETGKDWSDTPATFEAEAEAPADVPKPRAKK